MTSFWFKYYFIKLIVTILEAILHLQYHHITWLFFYINFYNLNHLSVQIIILFPYHSTMLPSENQTVIIPLTIQSHANPTHQMFCQHNNPVTFICRHSTCLADNSYLICSEDCLTPHFKHPEDLISYSTFNFSLPGLRKQTIKMQVAISSILREAVNKLLHLRITISQQIDKQLEKIKSMMMIYQREDQWNVQADTDTGVEKIKEYIYKIQDYNKIDDRIVYNVQEEHEENEKQVRDDVKRMWGRLGRNIKELFGTDVGIFEGDDGGNGQKKKCYEYKVEGNITKVLKLIKSTPKHVDRLKIYLNEEQICDYPARNTKNMQIWVVHHHQIREQTINQFSLRNYKETYETLLKNMLELDWIKKISLVVWDNYLQKEDKLELISRYRKDMPNVDTFIVDDKLKSVVHQI